MNTSGRLGALVLVVVAASVVVAIGGTRVGLLLPPANLNDGWVLAVRIAGAVAAVAGLVALLVQRKRLRSKDDRGYDPSVAALLAAGTIMGVLALVSFLAPPVRSANDPSRGGRTGSESVRSSGEATDRKGAPRRSSRAARIFEAFGLASSGAHRGGGITRRSASESLENDDGDGGFDWSILHRVGRVLLWVLLFAVAVIGTLALTGRLGPRRQEPAREMPLAVADVEAGLHASLGEVAYEGYGPRQQIIAAYHRLLAALAAAGAARQPQEAPHEHLYRVLAPLGVDPEPMHRLTELYVLAQFSERPITEQHRTAAGEALEVGLSRLRATNGPSRPAGTGPVAEKIHA